MMSDEKRDIVVGNVIIVPFEDTLAIQAASINMDDLLRFTGDMTKTIELPVAQTEADVDQLSAQMMRLFGAWSESGKEEKHLSDLYKSRLSPSSRPDDKE
ncbi:MAG: hypothetical protein RDV41_10400 [Planctomycetota bacterium]|nr:hypothetical protein [Planctomycetota bacterium]